MRKTSKEMAGDHNKPLGLLLERMMMFQLPVVDIIREL
jgi:hypothetical protein